MSKNSSGLSGGLGGGGWGHRDILFLIFLSLAIVLLAASSVRDKSVTWDEPWYLGVGFYLLKTHYFIINSVASHPPVSYYVNSMPFFVYDLLGYLPPTEELYPLDYKRLENGSVVFKGCYYCFMNAYSYRFLYGESFRDLDLLFYSRCSMILLLVVCNIYLFRLVKRYFGFETAAFIVLAFSFNPNILAHASLATTDMAPVCFNLVSFYYFLGFIEAKTPVNGFKAGAGLGLACLSKASSAYLVIVYLAALSYEFSRTFVFGRRGRSRLRPSLRTVAACVLVPLTLAIVLNAGYLFLPSPFFVGSVALPAIPTQYTVIFRSVRNHYIMNHEAYLNGLAYSKADVGVQSVFFVLEYWATVLLTKMPEAFLLLCAAASAYYLSHIARKTLPAAEGLVRLRIFILINVIVFLLFVINVRVLIGVRLVLFILPFVYLLFAEPVNYMLNKNRLMRGLAYLLLLASLMPALAYHPNYLSYFNLISGGPENGYRYLSDSNIDWGQDLPGLKKYMGAHNVRTIKLAYFGRAKIDAYGINYVSMPNNQMYLSTQRDPDIGCGPTDGLLAVSVNSLTGQYGDPGCYKWLSGIKPADNIGHSILIYNVTREDIAGLPR
jgi:hypothetical protein